MLSLVSLVIFGFLLGVRHATDADHVVAVTTILARERTLRAPAIIGSLWGVGHTTTVLLFGGAIIAFDIIIPARVAVALELVVAVMLIALGVSAIASGFRRPPAPSHAHEAESAALRTGRLRPLLTGVVHGLAGSAGAAILVVPMIRSRVWAIGYLLVFGLGTIAGMVLITAALALPLVFARRRFERWSGAIAPAAGILSIGLGVFLFHQLIGF